jgi:DNA-binding SARP family transcriptional activator
MLALEVLGPVVLLRDGVPVSLGVRKTQALLALLAIGGRCARVRAAHLLWPTLDESSARRNLRRELARLREAGASEVVIADSENLAIAAEVSCDAQDFVAAVQAGNAIAALKLWRGEPAAALRMDADDGGFDDWLRVEQARLMTLWRHAMTQAAAQHEAAGDDAAAIATLRALLADDPLQERDHRALIRVYASSGRREDALAQYRRCRDLLRDELGLEPMAETEAVAAAIRGAPSVARHGPSHAAPAPPAMPGRCTLPRHLPFVGREAEVARLDQAWLDGRAVLIEGESGIGKSRLALDVAKARGSCALVRCMPGDAQLPYGSFSRVLRTLVGPDPALGALPGWARTELARLLPELGAVPLPLRTAEERARFFEACALSWQVLAGDDFDVLLLDDCHLADSASLDLLVHVAQRRRELGHGGAREWLLLRPEMEPGRLRRLREGLQADSLTLPPLDGLAVYELVRRLSGAEDPARFARRLQQATGGNAFFIAESLRHLVEAALITSDAHGRWRTPFDADTNDYAELPVPASVREAVLARTRRLGLAAARVLETAALVAEPFAPALLASACALSELEGVLAVEEAVGAQLLREHEAGGFAFAHDLVRHSLEAGLSPTRRRLVHRRLALGAVAAGAPPAVIAAHHEASGDPARALPYRVEAGRQARDLHALPAAIAHWRAALEDGPTPAQAMELHGLLMQALSGASRRDESLAHAAELIAAAAGAPPEVQVDVQISVADLEARQSLPKAALDRLDALPPLADAAQRARSLAVRADALYGLGDTAGATAAGRAALALPELPAPDRRELLDTLALLEHAAGRPQAAMQWAQTLLDDSRASRDEAWQARALLRLGANLLDSGRQAAAEVSLNEAEALSRRLGRVALQRLAQFGLSRMHGMQSQPVAALAAAQQAWALSPEPTGQLRAMLRGALIQAHTACGDLGAAWTHAAAALQERQPSGGPQPAIYALAPALELFAWVGAEAWAQPWLATLDDERLRPMPFHGHALWLARCRFELLTGRIDAAQATLAQVHLPPGQAGLHNAVRRAELQARVSLARRDWKSALDALPASDAPGMSGELAQRVLAIRLTAESADGGPTDATCAAARAALQSESGHALAALMLHAALAAAGRDDTPGAFRARCEALAVGLRNFPLLEAVFRRRLVQLRAGSIT